MKKIAYYLLSLIVIVLTSCNDDGNNGYTPNPFPENTVADIVTFTGISSNTATFQLQEINDSKIVTLTASGVTIDENTFTKGTRIMLYYVPQNGIRYADDDITVYGYGYIHNAKPVVGDIADYPLWNDAQIYIFEMWRSGSYLNIYSVMQFDRDPQFKVIADAATVNNDFPDIYLTYSNEVNINATDQNFNASIDISQIWDLATCKGINIHLNNSNGENIYTLHKNQTIKPAE